MLNLIVFVHVVLLGALYCNSWLSFTPNSGHSKVITHSRLFNHDLSSYTDRLTSLSLPNKKYLIEFRGVLPYYRLAEVYEALQFLYHKNNLQSISEDDFLQYESVIPDTRSIFPICMYLHLPNDAFAIALAARCATIRSIIEVWGDGYTPEDVHVQTLANYDAVIAPVFHSKLASQQQHTNNSSQAHTNPVNITWMVTFRRYGRSGKSGLDYAGKRQLLAAFNTLLKKLPGQVDLKQPDHTLVYFEDWHSYHNHTNHYPADICHQQRLQLDEEGEADQGSQVSNSDSLPLLLADRYLFGRILIETENIDYHYNLSDRPFVGTTSMKPLAAHIAATMAQLSADDLVLDPFCGTGSLLIAAAHFGARVVGTDIVSDFATNQTAASAVQTQQLHQQQHQPRRRMPLQQDDVANNKEYEQQQDEQLLHSSSAGDDDSSAKQQSSSSQGSTSSQLKGKKRGGKQQQPLISRNAKFIRKDGQNQQSKTVEDNFSYYGLQDRIADFFAVDASRWLLPTETQPQQTQPSSLLSAATDELLLQKYDMFDAIISDPPFARREKFVTSSEAANQDEREEADVAGSMMIKMEFMTDPSSMGNPYAAFTLLLQIAQQRLKPNKRLICWLPTDGDVQEEEVHLLLKQLVQQAAEKADSSHSSLQQAEKAANSKMEIIRICPEYMSSVLIRWICVFEKRMIYN